MNTISLVGVGLIIFGAFWAFMMWVSETWGGGAGGITEAGENPIAEIIKAIADFFRAAAEVLKLKYGAPALVMLIGLVLVIIGSAS